jgi:hypothetical protein
MRPRTGIAAFGTVVGVAGALAAAGTGAQASTAGHPVGQGARLIPGDLLSNANTPGVIDSTNPVTGAYYRAVASLSADGLRNITGKVNPNGTVTIWGVTSTVSGGGDQGADPNQLVAVTDKLSAATLPSSERFFTVVAPRDDQVVRGVSFTPGTRQ